MTPSQPRIDADWLGSGPIARVLAALDADGEEARVVGGAVRDTLLGVPLGDVDIATTALPTEVIRRADAQGWKHASTGIAHGTVTLVVDGQAVEVTTLRQDVETFGRKARVRFGRDWEADALRRDFTINALSVRRDGAIVDPVDGLADIATRRVRFIGDPHGRIREDYLRILRFFRFHAAFADSPPDADGVAAAIALRDGLRTLARERVRVELLKLLGAPGVVATVTVMADAGLIEPIIGVPLLAGLSKSVALDGVLGLPPDPLRRLGAVALHVADDADRLAINLRFANRERERLAVMADCWWRATDLDDAAARVLLYRLGERGYVDRVTFAWTRARNDVNDPAWRERATLPQRWSAPRFPLRASDFLNRSVEKGPSLGAAIAAAEAAWLEADFPDDPDTLAALADRVADPHAGTR